MCGIFKPGIVGKDRRDVAANPIEAGDDFVFEPARRHQLHADADAEERPAAAAHRLFQRLDHAGNGVEPAPAIGEGADAGQNDVLGARDVLRAPGHLDFAREARFARGALERLVGRVQIARAVVDDRDAHVSGPPPGTAREPAAAPKTAGRGEVAGRARGAGAANARSKKPSSAVDELAAQTTSASGPPAARQRGALQGAALEAEIERAQGIEPDGRVRAEDALGEGEADERGAQGPERERAPQPMGEEPDRPEHERRRAEAELQEFRALERRRVAVAGRTMHRIDRHSLMAARSGRPPLPLSYSAPLVEGTRAACLGSIASAAPSARATPLKQDSAI